MTMIVLAIVLNFMLVLCNVDKKFDKSYAAVKDVHRHLDDDHDGNINTKETADYMKTELEDSNNTKKITFHKNDSDISVDELWNKWKSSEVYQWTTDDVIKWLIEVVKLPEYVEVFRKNKVNGKNMPRLATPTANYVQKELNIATVTHRKKIYLRASDVLLFGPPEGFTKAKKPIDKNFLAIQAVHAHLDDDHDGSIDVEESVEYVREELESTSNRHSMLHNNDAFISVDELWDTWQHSEVHNWTNEQVIKWLINTVGLPQYEAKFREKRIDGRSIPRIATDKSSYLQKELGISDVIHQKKIYLRASDIILFGAPESYSYLKDFIVLFLILLSTLACLYAFTEKKRTRKEMDQMSKDMEQLQLAEITLKSLQSESNLQDNVDDIFLEKQQTMLEEIETAKREAHRLRNERSKNQEDKLKLSLVEQELAEVRLALARSEMELNSLKSKTPISLQGWLKLTYKNESKYFQYRKQIALNQMEDAKEACDKVSKTRRSVFGSLRLAHGQSIDLVDQKIVNARTALAEVTNDLQERQKRWRHIENICNFNITNDTLLPSSTLTNHLRRESLVAEAIAEIGSLSARSIESLAFGTEVESEEFEREGAISNETASIEPINRINSNVSNYRKASVESTNQSGSIDSYNVGDSTTSQEISTEHINSKPVSLKLIDEQSSFVSASTPVINTANAKYGEQMLVNKHVHNDKNYDLARSASERYRQTCIQERHISRANTEPNSFALLNNSKSSIESNKLYEKEKSNSLTRPLSLQVNYKEHLSRSSGSLPIDEDQGIDFNVPHRASSDCDDMSYLSDESINSISSTAKKQKKGIRKLFSRKSKLLK